MMEGTAFSVWERQLAAEIDKGDHTFGSRTVWKFPIA
jgi:hypothetical protein